ncbi:hypothetical protein MdSGHV008 [Musca domestica salivary gland hypertrophy virus]|uniref:Uncharacterized protein n=1 Tax=Musca hytrovirus(isolate Musca domestica/United States/Boucias/-) TaxID=523909 RepID=B2YFY5_MHVB|nr:hypothetical protein MdSGHV008 [Musca domestica salivary gland hypertrophy virus]ACD03467.1 hypothetical protein MdSGHV008 [Musca domestica salivary gland hypertrophy virus]
MTHKHHVDHHKTSSRYVSLLNMIISKAREHIFDTPKSRSHRIEKQTVAGLGKFFTLSSPTYNMNLIKMFFNSYEVFLPHTSGH